METPQPEHKMTLTVGDQEIEATRFNTGLYTFAGELACYSHIFVTREVTDDGVVRGNYIWQTDDIYGEVVKKLRYFEWPQYLNILQVSEGDVQAFYNRHYKDLERLPGFPVAWADDEEYTD